MMHGANHAKGGSWIDCAGVGSARRIIARLVGVLLPMLSCQVSSAAIIYVDADAPGPVHDGASWKTAYPHPDDAFADVIFNDEIRIAQGTYKPDASGMPDPRQATINLPSFAMIKGGYAGWGESDPDARDIDAFITRFSGDVLGDDLPGQNRDDNSFNVVTANLVGPETTLSGVTVSGGNSTAPFAPPFFPLGKPGGGMWSVGTVTIESCTFRDNQAVVGGGMFNFEGSPILLDTVFENNHAAQGGALGLFGTDDPLPASAGDGGVAHGTPSLSGCRFENNTASEFAGGVWVDGIAENPTFTDCRFLGNSAVGDGGGMWSGGGFCNLRNCLVAGNVAGDEGGGIYADTLVNVYHSTFFGNVAEAGGGMYYVFVRPGLLDSIFWGNEAGDATGENAQASGGFLPPLADYSCIEGWTGDWGGEGNIGLDPGFIPGPDGCFYLDPVRSGCIDVGSTTAVDKGLQFSTTHRDENPDVSVVDLGFHFPISGLAYLPGDSNRDRQNDLRDVAAFQWCLGEDASPCCLVFDIDGDTSVSLADLAGFVGTIDGP